MKLLLLNDVAGVGERGSIVEAADEHARTVLIPHGLAVAATEEAVQAWHLAEKRHAQQAEEELRKVEERVDEIDGVEVEIKALVNEGGTLALPVTLEHIVEALKHEGITGVDPQQIRIDTPILSTGEHKIIVEYPHGLEAEVRVRVIEEQPV